MKKKTSQNWKKIYAWRKKKPPTDWKKLHTVVVEWEKIKDAKGHNYRMAFTLSQSDPDPERRQAFWRIFLLYSGLSPDKMASYLGLREADLIELLSWYLSSLTA